jgi:hypothetical protein
MAAKPAVAGDDPFKDLTKEAGDRLSACEAQKREFDMDLREGYYFAQPHRSREIRSAQITSSSKPKDADTLQTGVAMELCKDFLTVLINAFMPQAEPWAERRPGMFIPDNLVGEAKKQAADQDPKIFDAIRASNLYEELPKLGADPALGTGALWVADPRPAENIVVQIVPLHELEINIGPFGSIDDRFVVRHTRNRHVKAVLGQAIYDKIPESQRKTIERDGAKPTVIRWGYWRLWERLDDVVWQHVVMVDMKVIHAATLVGEGACPLIPFRFNPMPEWAFGSGPLIESLPDLRQMDELAKKKIEHVDLVLAPPSTYPDDSFTAINQGIESGRIYPVRPGGAVDVKPIFEAGSMQPAIYEVSEIERSLQHRFFLDWPQQRGDTPPTATQWLDEMQLAQRRLGTPGSSFWKECPAQIFLRFKYLLERRGAIKPIQVNGKTVSLEPYNPAQRAAEQQEVAMAARFLSLAAPVWPEEFRLKIDGSASMEAIIEKMRVSGLIKVRSQSAIGNVVDGIKQLSQGRQQVRPADPNTIGQQ